MIGRGPADEPAPLPPRSPLRAPALGRDRDLGRCRGGRRRRREGDRQSDVRQTSRSGHGSTEATDLLDDKLPHQANGTVPIVLSVDRDGSTRAPTSRPSRRPSSRSPRRQASAARSARSASRVRRALQGREDRLRLAQPGDRTDELDDDEADEIIDAAQPAVDAGSPSRPAGIWGRRSRSRAPSGASGSGSWRRSLILLLALGTVVAMSLPITIAIIGVITGLCTIALLGHVVAVPTVAPTLGTMIGLGVGIDYSLFIVTRYRRRLAERGSRSRRRSPARRPPRAARSRSRAGRW